VAWDSITRPLPQTIKNTDKAIGRIILAAGENLEARIRQNAGKVKARGKVELGEIYRTADEKRKLENRIAATRAALEDLNSNQVKTDAPSEIEDDWLNLFARLSEDKSSEHRVRNICAAIIWKNPLGGNSQARLVFTENVTIDGNNFES
jgi:hypothetical protein